MGNKSVNFEEIVKNVIQLRANDPIEGRVCPDQYVGYISDFSQNSKDFPVREKADKRRNNVKCLIMLLESPHKEEFKKVLAPAKGSTGRLIRKHIKDVNGLSNYTDYGLILMNAIQNQCSLGLSTMCYRDEVFVSFWNKGAKDDFINRLKSLYKPGDVILNCCTKGKSKKQLRKLVQESIPENMGQVLKRTHPSSWYNQVHRNSEWK